MSQVFEMLGDPDFWHGLWNDIVTVMMSGTPPVYVQYLMVTTIYLAYLLFVYDPRRVRNMPLAKWIGNPTSLVYFVALIVITLGVSDVVTHATDPETIRQLRPTRIPVFSDILKPQEAQE